MDRLPQASVEKTGLAITAGGSDDNVINLKNWMGSSPSWPLTARQSQWKISFLSSGGWVNIKVKLPHFHVSDACRVPIFPDAPVETAARRCTAGIACNCRRGTPGGLKRRRG